MAARGGDCLGVRIQRGFLASGLGLALFGTFFALLLVGTGIFTYYWITYGRMIDERMAGHINQTTARIYATPQRIFDGEALAASGLVDSLQRAGYNESNAEGAPGWYTVKGDVVEIHPERDSYFGAKNALRVEFAGHEIHSIRLLDDGSAHDSAEIEPELLTNLFDSSREKRRKSAVRRHSPGPPERGALCGGQTVLRASRL